MKKIIQISALVVLAVGLITYFRHNSQAKDPAVIASVTALQSGRTKSAMDVRPHAQRPKINPPIVTAAPSQVLTDAVAVSSFFMASELAGLTPEQLVDLEDTLSDARRATFRLLLQRGTVTQYPNGSVRVEIPAQGAALDSMHEYVTQSIAGIVGKERMESLSENLGLRFDAKFAFFGKYDTTFDISFQPDPSSGSPRMVTMQKSYGGLPIFGSHSGYMKSTDILYTPSFEADYFPLDSLKPKS